MSSFDRKFFWWSMGLSTFSGVVFFGMKYLLTPLDSFSVINHPWQPFFLKFHILVVPLLVYSLGVLATKHIIPKYRAKKRIGRYSGVSMSVLFLILTLSGYLIQVISSKALAGPVGWVHSAVGAIVFVLSLVHSIKNKRSS